MDGLWNPLTFLHLKVVARRHSTSGMFIHPARWISSCFTNLMELCASWWLNSPTQLKKHAQIKLYRFLPTNLGENSKKYLRNALRVTPSPDKLTSPPRLQAWQIWLPRSRPRNTDWCHIRRSLSPIRLALKGAVFSRRDSNRNMPHWAAQDQSSSWAPELPTHTQVISDWITCRPSPSSDDSRVRMHRSPQIRERTRYSSSPFLLSVSENATD